MKTGCQKCSNLDLVLEDNIIGCPDCGAGVRDLRTRQEIAEEVGVAFASAALDCVCEYCAAENGHCGCGAQCPDDEE